MSDKKLHTLTIDPEFRDLIPPLNDDELTMLEESIVANGCESPLIVWNGVIVDGHNRHAICQKHNIPFAVTEKEFSSREDAMLWMLRNQLGRRNLNSYQRSDLVLKLEPLMASEAKLRKGQRTDLGQNSAPGSQMGKTSHKLAEMAGVSHDTMLWLMMTKVRLTPRLTLKFPKRWRPLASRYALCAAAALSIFV